MSKQAETLNKELFDELANLDPVPFQANGDEIALPEKADFFQFHFHKDGHDYGTITVSIDDSNHLIVWYNNNITRSSSSGNEGDSWISLIKRLKRFSHQHQMSGFKTMNQDRLHAHMKQRVERKKLDESWRARSKTQSVNENNTQVKLIIKHNRQMTETDQRFRHIERIFVENHDGSRYPVPTTRPSIARAFARHIAEGGEFNDQRWTHIREMTHDLIKLESFSRAVRNKQFNESAGELVTEALTHCANLKETIHRISTGRGYNSYFEDWKPAILEQDQGIDHIAELFTENRLDSRIEGALPVIARLRPQSRSITEVSDFERWANDMIDEALDAGDRRHEDRIIELLGSDSSPLPLGPDAINAISELHDIIDDDQLNERLRTAADGDADGDARPIIIGWMKEHALENHYRDVLDKIEPRETSEPDLPEPTNPQAQPSDVPDLAQAANPQPEVPDQMPAPVPPDNPATVPELPQPVQEADDLTRIIRLSRVK